VAEGEAREQIIERLTSFPIGMDRAYVERKLLDDDLWVVDPELRVGLEPEEAVQAWEEAHNFVVCLAEGFSNVPSPVNGATIHLLWDAVYRAEEALRRARERVENAA
jgi:hypothetical protein